MKTDQGVTALPFKSPCKGTLNSEDGQILCDTVCTTPSFESDPPSILMKIFQMEMSAYVSIINYI